MGATISPLATPAPAVAPVTVAPATAAPAAATQAPESFDFDAHDRELGVGNYVHGDGGSDVDEGLHDAIDTRVEQPVIDKRDRIESALRDIRDTEPAATSTTDLNAATSRYPDGITPYPAEREQALAAFVHAGIGVSAAGALWSAGMAALKQPVTTNQAGAMAALGDNADTTVAAARAVVAQASTKYPGLKDFLNRTGLGNDPSVIRYLASKAKT
ncbi:hypothetical protein [Paraburkholderia sp. HD33-4]|uniref:hypothetical protein n=1 Tax=Paraburkholderia sp. HD33-4 TaxID=2883242 RepID=UPI001F25E9F5|nr:hypothetical protein [Paraburkholderia sp. HD33-4]